IGLPLRGARVALEGFGKVGSGAAKFFAREGARVVALSTVRGAIHAPEGLDVGALLALRSEHGDVEALERYASGDAGVARIAASELYGVPADILVPGARPDAIHAGNVEGVTAALVAPAANIPYGEGMVRRLHARGCTALPD